MLLKHQSAGHHRCYVPESIHEIGVLRVLGWYMDVLVGGQKDSLAIKAKRVGPFSV